MMSEPVEIVCDACERSFPAEPTVEKIACPYCGDVNRVPSSVPVETPATAPDSNDRPDTEERFLRVARPALVRGHPIASLASSTTTLAGGGFLILALTSPSIPHWMWWIGLAVLLAGGGWMTWIFVLGHRWDRLRITSRRTIDERGIVMRSTSEVLHQHVRNIRITQSFWQRIVGIGDLEIDSAAGDGVADIRIRNVPDPDGIKRIIDAARGLGTAED
jgi:hypothetical protein